LSNTSYQGKGEGSSLLNEDVAQTLSQQRQSSFSSEKCQHVVHHVQKLLDGN
jgi:hypothetical protein